MLFSDLCMDVYMYVYMSQTVKYEEGLRGRLAGCLVGLSGLAEVGSPSFLHSLLSSSWSWMISRAWRDRRLLSVWRFFVVFERSNEICEHLGYFCIWFGCDSHLKREPLLFILFRCPAVINCSKFDFFFGSWLLLENPFEEILFLIFCFLKEIFRAKDYTKDVLHPFILDVIFRFGWKSLCYRSPWNTCITQLSETFEVHILEEELCVRINVLQASYAYML